ncbi:MAG: DMT family transporter [Acidimicrobiales bacterium]
MTDTVTSASVADESTTQGLLGAALAVTAWGAASIIPKAMDMGGMAIAVYRFALYFAVLVGWMAYRKAPFSVTAIRRSVLGGIALGLDIALFFSAVKLTTVVNATIIGSLQPILVGVVGVRFFGEKIKAIDAVWSLVALAGVTAVVLSSSSTAESSVTGDLLAIGALFSWSAYFIASKQSKGSITPTEFTAGTAFWAFVINLPLAIAFGQDLGRPSNGDLVKVVILAVVAGVIGHSLMNWSLVRIPLWIGSTFTLLIPVASSLLAWAFLDESLSWGQGIGMAVVIGSLAAIVVGQHRRKIDQLEVAVP